jgi:glutathione S-transferase
MYNRLPIFNAGIYETDWFSRQSLCAQGACCHAGKKDRIRFFHENVWASDTTIQESNPLGKVPCLVMEDGGAMFDSRVIVEYLDTLTPVGKLIPPNGRERAEVKCWEALADGVADAGMLVRLEKTMRPEEQRSKEWVRARCPR